MAEPITISEYENAEPIQDTDLREVYQGGSGGTRREKKVPEAASRTYYQGTLPAQISNNTTSISNIKDGTDNFTALSISPNRIAMQEKVSGTLTTSGWYTIAELSPSHSFDSVSADFKCFHKQSYIDFKASITPRGGAIGSTINKESCLITDRVNSNTGDGYIKSVRIAKSDTVGGAGAKVQVQIADTSGTLTVLIDRATANSVIRTWSLVTPYLDNTPTLPDGVTHATFIEAGAELEWPVQLLNYNDMSWHVLSSTVLRVLVDAKEILKQGSASLTLTYGTLIFKDGANTSYTFNGSEIIGSPNVVNTNRLYFDITIAGGHGLQNYGNEIFGQTTKIVLN